MIDKLKNWLCQFPKRSHTIRILAGAYLLYISFNLFRERAAAGNLLFSALAILLFLLVGAFFLASSLYALQTGHYSENFQSFGNDEKIDIMDADNDRT